MTQIADMSPSLTTLFSELVDGAAAGGGAFILNSGDVGLLRSLDKLSADDASCSVNDGATIAVHAQHLRYGLSLMNRWAREADNPFADARWDDAWKTSTVNGSEWDDIRRGLRHEAHRWLKALGSPREATVADLCGMMGSIAHLAYHLGAIRQIDRSARGPKEGDLHGLAACDGDPHEVSGSHRGRVRGETLSPVGHAGIFLDFKAGGAEVGCHLLGRPFADHRLADEPEDQSHQWPSIDGVVVHDQGRSRTAACGNAGPAAR